MVEDYSMEAWEDAGFEADEAKKWQNQGFTPVLARIWRDAGHGPQELPEPRSYDYPVGG